MDASELLADVSHDLRTPLNSILGMSHLALEASPNSAVRECLNAIAAAAEQLVDIVNDISDFENIHAGRAFSSEETFHVRQTFDKFVGSLRSTIAEKEAIVNIDISGNVPKRLRADVSRLRQVVSNIIRHLISLQVDDTFSVIVEHESRNALRVDIRGQSPPTTTKEDESPERIGLKIARTLASRLGGSVQQLADRSVIGYSVTLPASEADQDSQQKSREPPAALHLLLAEDVPANRTVVTRLLEKHGHRVTVACNGREALERFQAAEFDAILMDVQMPGLDGYAATREIRRTERTSSSRRTPIVGLTAHATQTVWDKCIQAGMDEYLPKPIDAGKLIPMLDDLVRRDATQQIASPKDVEFSKTGSQERVLDLDEALKRLGGDIDLFKEFVEVFDEDGPRLLRSMRDALAADDPDQIAHAAHKLRGLTANLGADLVHTISGQLEDSCGEKNLDVIRTLFDQLDSEVNRLNSALDEFR